MSHARDIVSHEILTWNTSTENLNSLSIAHSQQFIACIILYDHVTAQNIIESIPMPNKRLFSHQYNQRMYQLN